MQNMIDINGLPLLACLACSGVLVYLGSHVVERKVIFVDLALAQIAALGVMWAILMGYDHEHDTTAVTLYSLAFTALGAAVFSITRTRNERVPHEALIGIIYVAASAGGLVLADRFALGTEALKELIAGRVALVTPEILTKLAITCAVVAMIFVALHRRFMAISRDPKAAEAAGIFIRGWDFVFYMLFGVLITQCVSVLGVLPVFAYLVIPAVAGALLFTSLRSRLLFGWGFAGAISLIGLETARHAQLDPGPTIVCLFAAALVLIGVVLFLKSHSFKKKAVVRVVGFAILVVAFLRGTLMFQKQQPTDELATAIEFANSGDPTHARQAMESFKRFPHDQARWLPLVIPMLAAKDRVVRNQSAQLLGDVKASAAVGPLGKRLGDGVEDDDEVRETVIRSLKTIGDPSAVPILVDASGREEESDLAVAMDVAAFELGTAAQADKLKGAADALATVMADDEAPHAARRDAADALRAHVAFDATCRDDAQAAAWWQQHRGELSYKDHRFVLPPGSPPAPCGGGAEAVAGAGSGSGSGAGSGAAPATPDP